jgi:periplasmic divalent cation tolerance protein
MTNKNIVLCTVPNSDTADHIASLLINSRLAACVNVLPHIASYYMWKGKLEKDQEYLLIIKSHQAKFEALKKKIHEHHPYNIPEIIQIDITDGNRSYLEWMDKAINS